MIAGHIPSGGKEHLQKLLYGGRLDHARHPAAMSLHTSEAGGSFGTPSGIMPPPQLEGTVACGCLWMFAEPTRHVF